MPFSPTCRERVDVCGDHCVSQCRAGAELPGRVASDRLLRLGAGVPPDSCCVLGTVNGSSMYLLLVYVYFTTFALLWFVHCRDLL